MPTLHVPRLVALNPATLRAGLLAGLVGFAASMAISALLGIGPGSAVFRVNDVVFNADASTYFNRYTEPQTDRPSPLHPLFNFTWRPIGRAVTAVTSAILGPERGPAVAVRLVMAVSVGLGIGALFACGSALGLGPIRLSALLALAAPASSQLIASIPETYGPSFALLACGFVAFLLDIGPRAKLAILSALGLLIAGTTTSNAVLAVLLVAPLLLIPEDRGGLRPAFLTPMLLRLAATTMLVVGSVGLVAIVLNSDRLVGRFPNLIKHVRDFLHLNLVKHPGQAMRDVLASVVFPIVGPIPEFLLAGPFLKYKDYHAVRMTPIHWAAMGSWVAILGVGVWRTFRSAETRLPGILLASWFAFNILFHTLWGSEIFLYTPHWSWALLAFAIIGWRDLPAWVLAVLCAVVAAGEFTTLVETGRLLATAGP